MLDKQTIKMMIDPTDRYRAIGRTTMLAECYIELLAENVGLEIDVKDHYPLIRAHEDLANLVETKAIEFNKIELNKRSRFEIKRVSKTEFKSGYTASIQIIK